MKNTGILFFLPFLLYSCSNDLDIAADHKEITVVYGLLNYADNEHYISVFKGFLDENTSALEIAKNPDSVYYDDNLVVELYDGSQAFELEKVIGPNRVAGIFVDSPNYAYRFTGTLKQDAIYTITLINKESDHIVTAQTPVVKDFDIVRPSDLQLINLATRSLNDVQWRPAENGVVYQLIMRFHYTEWDVSSPNEIDSFYVDWLIVNNFTSGTLISRFDGTEFLRYLGNQLQVNQNTFRRALNAPLEFRFFVGAEELYQYITVSGAQTGITSLQVKPAYTNVTNGLGIFSSRYFKTKPGVGITPLSIDSLSCGQHTRNLNFVNSSNCF